MAKMSIIPKRLLRLGVLEAVSQKHLRNQQVPKTDDHDITDFADFAGSPDPDGKSICSFLRNCACQVGQCRMYNNGRIVLTSMFFGPT
jgi:hypothetical protein